MYIEDVSKPFLTLENTRLSKEEFFASRRYAVKYFFNGNTRRGLGIFFIFPLVISLLSTVKVMITRPADLNDQNYLLPVFLFLFVVIFLVVFPNMDEKKTKLAYDSNRTLQSPYTVRFYKEYFEWENENEYVKLARTDIDKCLENNQMVLLKRKDGAIFTIMKDWMTESQFFILRDYLQEVYVYRYKAVK